MRVAMVTPMSPESAIADVMVQAIPHLTAHWDLEVWCPAEPALRPCPVPVTPFAEPDASVVAALSEFDLVLHVLGDSPWHSRILPLTRMVPGLVVVHDAALTNLVRQTAIERGELDDLARMVEASHGASAAEVLRTAAPLGGPDAWLRFCAEVPLDDYAVRTSLGAVVHSLWHAGRLDGLLLGEVTVAPLPVPSTRLGFDEDEHESSARMLANLPHDALLLVTVGAVNANRRVDLLLRAIADDDVLRERVHLWAVGPADARVVAELSRQARTAGIGGHFAALGRVSDAALQDVLARADIAAALRDPVLEGQSASVLTQLLSGTPVVVFDQAHYAELPDDVAIKVDPQDALAGLTAALRRLVDDPAGRRSRGERGRDYVLSSRSGSAYAAALLEAGDRALAARPQVQLASDIGARLRRLGLAEHPVVVDATTDLTFELYDLA